MAPRIHYNKVAGISHANDDGVSRQQIVSLYCRTGSPLRFIPEPDNQHSKHAVSIWVETAEGSKQLGYVPKEIDPEFIREVFQNKKAVVGRITDVTGGTKAKPTRGVNYEYVFLHPSEAELFQFPKKISTWRIMSMVGLGALALCLACVIFGSIISMFQ